MLHDINFLPIKLAWPQAKKRQLVFKFWAKKTYILTLKYNCENKWKMVNLIIKKVIIKSYE